MPLRRPLSLAAFRAPLTSSSVVSRFGVKVRSIRLTFGTGTRTAEPSSLPLSSGSTSPTARIGVDLVEDLLVVGIGVDGRHQAALDADRVVQHLGDRCEAVGCAR